jgi:hypothetical protein
MIKRAILTSVLVFVTAAACVQQSPPQVGPAAAQSKGSTIHHHVESCWTDRASGTDERQVDMMLVVIGLNHRLPNGGKTPVDAEGVREVADAIKQAWPNNPERLVIVSSSFTNGCPPSSGACLKNELASRYPGATFDLQDVRQDEKYGTRGVVVGARWHVETIERVVAPSIDYEAVAKVRLKDRDTQSLLTVFATHNASEKTVDREIRELTDMERKSFPIAPGRTMPPILAGDFNMTESDPNAASASKTFQTSFDWLNRNLMCPSVKGKPVTFTTQNGRVMQAVIGLQVPEDPALAFTCASATLQTVRLSYSVDESGRIANRPLELGDGFDGNALNNGIALNKVSHNVLALGLHIKPLTVPASCNCVDDPCKPNACHPQDCGGACGTGHCGLGSSCCDPRRVLCCDNQSESCTSAKPGKPLSCQPLHPL